MSEQATINPESPISPAQALEAGRALLERFEVKVSAVTQTDEFVRAMDQLNPRFQGDRDLVRFELEQDQTEWPQATQDEIMRTARSLRMVETEPEEDEEPPEPIETPLEGDKDVVVGLGAARKATKDRPLYAAKAIHDGKATAKKFVIVGSARKLGEAEREVTADYAPGAVTEFDLCVGAAKAVAEAYPEIEVETIFLDEEKAGTPDVMRKVLSTLQDRGELPEGASVAAITTQIYQTSTSFDVARVAKEFGITDTMVAGNPSDPNIVAKRTPATYFSEILRTLKAAALAQPRG